MKVCRMCRWAAVCSDKEERICESPDKKRPERVRAGAPACESFQISAYTFLESVAGGERKLEDLSWRAQHYREMAERATGSMEAARLSGCGGASKVAGNCDRLIDIAILMDERAAVLKPRLAIALQMLEDLPQREERQVLELRFGWRKPKQADGRRYSWEEIAKIMICDQSTARRIYHRALDHIQEQMDALGIR